MTDQPIVITGALGHIGSGFIHRGIKSGEHYYLIDDLSAERYASLFSLPKDARYRFIKGDISKMNFDCIAGAQVVIHLAALTDAASSHERVAEVERVNYHGLKRVADACLAHGVPLLFPSTTSVYGSQSEKVDESCQELAPQSPYAKAKLESEQYLQHLGQQGLRFVIARFGTIFGPTIGWRFHTAVNKFLWQAVNGEPLSVWKTAWKQRRPYLDINDAIVAIRLILDKQIYDGQTYNVLTENYTVEQIVGAIKKHVPHLKVEYVDSPIMNQLSYDVDGSKFEAHGFSPAGTIDDGIYRGISQLQGINTAYEY